MVGRELIKHNKDDIVLCISGFDPSGGAGIQADLETVNSLGSYAISLLTCLTVQNSSNVSNISSVNSKLFQKQLSLLSEDIIPAAIKIGLLSSKTNINILSNFLATKASSIPTVLDPIIYAGGGKLLLNKANQLLIVEKLFPYVYLLTPNMLELQLLANKKSLEDCLQQIFTSNVKNVLVTDIYKEKNYVTNVLYEKGRKDFVKSWSWSRLKHNFHGTGCTLSAAIAAFLAQKRGLVEACEKAQQFVYKSITNYFIVGKGFFPNRN